MDYSMIPIYLTILIPILIVTWKVYEGYGRRRREREDKLKRGIGRGVEGFQTSVRKVALPAEMVQRIRSGQVVSPEEIARAQQLVAQNSSSSNNQSTTTSNNNNNNNNNKDNSAVDQQWIPNSSKSSAKLRKK